MITEPIIILRLIVATFLGAFIGFERERSHKAAGLRTHALTAMASALLAIITIYIHQNYGLDSEGYGFDSRIIANAIVGIGFVGGGAIIRFTDRVVGTTTAASLFSVAAIGIATGLGMYFASLTAALLAYLLLAVVGYFQREIEKKDEPKIDIINHE